MSIQDGFYTEVYEKYVQPDTLTYSREVAVSTVLAAVDAECPDVLSIETRKPTSLEYGEALQHYSRQVGVYGYKQIMKEFGATPVRKLVEVEEGGLHAIDIFEQELRERQQYYKQAFKDTKHSDWLDKNFPVYRPDQINDYMRSELPGHGLEPQPVEFMSAGVRSTLTSRTLIQLRDEKQHLISIARRRPAQLGRWAAGTLLRTS